MPWSWLRKLLHYMTIAYIPAVITIIIVRQRQQPQHPPNDIADLGLKSYLYERLPRTKSLKTQKFVARLFLITKFSPANYHFCVFC